MKFINNKVWLLTAIVCLVCHPAAAGLISNGGFESGLSGWTTADQVGSDGQFLAQTGTLSPVNLFIVPTPPEGSSSAMTDSLGPGSHILYQDFLVPAVVTNGFVNFSLLINNLSDRFVTPDHLDFATPALNQRARVDILATSVDPFSIATADILQNLYETQVGGPLVSGYTDLRLNITGLLQMHAGETLRLRFSEVDNVGPFNFGVDAVDITVNAIPEPATWFTTLGALLGVGLFRRVSRH